MNNDVIRLLPDSVANQIAAGEVIHRPASVIKELVENSIDAGATSIQIILKDGGRTLIQVIDNGKGMSPTDARMAFERHATSKITSADDLYSLHTMGFRGEALPSVASVAQIEMRTKQPGETIGCHIRISESKFESQEPCACPPGTNIMVKNLFFHMPARRKFLKKDSVELSHILREFERLALVNHDVDFTITHNDATLFQLIHGSLKQRINSLFGKSIGSQIIPMGTETPIVKISGFIGLPSHAKKRTPAQFFFVNGRNMRDPYFHKAVLSCYTELIAPDAQPAYFINFEVNPADIDVNAHPQKYEIKFENAQAIWQILTAAIKQALGRVNAAGAIDFDSPDALPDIPVFLPDANAQPPSIETDPDYDPFDLSSAPARRPAPVAEGARVVHRSHISSSAPRDWDKLYDSFVQRRDDDLAIVAHTPQPAEPEPIPFKPRNPEATSDNPGPDPSAGLLTILSRYIALPTPDGLMLINRHRAHVRVLYDRFIERLAKAPMPSQRLIFPESITLTPSQSAILSALSDTAGRLGYEISFLGDCTWAVNAVPSLPGGANPVETLARMAADLDQTGEAPRDTLLEPAALALARSAAFLPDRHLSDEESEALVADLFRCSEPSFTPDGLPIIHTLDKDALEKLFN